jgi:hypothetical protein
MKKERIGLVAAVLMIVWLSAALVRVENQRYAMLTGMCPGQIAGLAHLPDPVCLQNVETRIAWYWHLFYALKG